MADELNNEVADDIVDFDMIDLSEEPAVEEEVKEEVKEEKVVDDIPKDDDDDEELDEEEEKPKEELKEEIKEEPAEEVKKLSAKFGDDSIDIPADAVLKHTVDGEEVEVTVQELLNNFSGKEAWDKKFTELGQDKREFSIEKNNYEVEKNDLVGKVNHFVESVSKQDVKGALEGLGKITGANPIDLRRDFLQLMSNEARAYFQLEPEAQKELDMKLENDYYKDREEHSRQEASADQSFSEVENDVLKLQVKHGISNERLVQLQDELQDKSIDLSLEALEQQYLNNAALDKASSLLEQVDPALKNESSYIDQVQSFMLQNPDLSEADVVDSIKEAFGTVNKQAPDKEVKSASKSIKSRIAKNSPHAKNQEDVIDTDDLDDVVDFDDVSY